MKRVEGTVGAPDGELNLHQLFPNFPDGIKNLS